MKTQQFKDWSELYQWMADGKPVKLKNVEYTAQTGGYYTGEDINRIMFISLNPNGAGLDEYQKVIEQKTKIFYNSPLVMSKNAIMPKYLISPELQTKKGWSRMFGLTTKVISWGEPIELPVDDDGCVDWALVEGVE